LLAILQAANSFVDGHPLPTPPSPKPTPTITVHWELALQATMPVIHFLGLLS
jgi:hypothetical protein